MSDQAGLSGSNAIHLPYGIKVASAAAGPLAPPASSLMLCLLWLLLKCFFPHREVTPPPLRSAA